MVIADVKDIAKIIDRTLDSDRDTIIVISGLRGEGKSTASIQIGMQRGNFDFERNIIYNRKEAITKIKSVEKKSTLVIDEAINVLYRRDFAKGEQKELIKLMNMCRDRNLCLIFNIPTVWNLDRDIIQTMVRLWIHIDERGTGFCFTPDASPFATDKWHRLINERIFKDWEKEKSFLSKSVNFDGTLRFKDLNDENKKKYLKIKEEKRLNAEKEDLVDEDNLKRIKLKGLYTGIQWLREREFLKDGSILRMANELKLNESTFRARLGTSEPIDALKL